MGPAAHLLKARNAVLPSHAIARFPWTDHSVASYCFHLPERHRFERKLQTGKIIVRDMLRQFLGYDERRIGKRVFKFNKRRFIEEQLPFCRDEILGCSLWGHTIERVFDNLAWCFLRGGRTENALLTLLVVSLWHNHWIRGGLSSLFQLDHRSGVAA